MFLRKYPPVIAILIGVCVFTLDIVPTAVPSHAAIITLTNQNSLVQINDTSSAGQINWFVDGTNNLSQRWFWISVNGAAPVAVDTLSAPTVAVQSANSVTLSYSNPALAKVDLTFTLLGQALGTLGADLAVQAGVTNNTGAPATVRLFEYANFDLNNAAANDYLSFRNANYIQQSKGVSVITQDTVISSFQGWQAGAPATVLAAVTTNTLTNTPLIGDSAGPGDESWAVRWNRNLAGFGGAFTVSNDEHVQGTTPNGIVFTLADFALDGFVDQSDLPALMNALSDLSKFKSKLPKNGAGDETNLRKLGNFEMLPDNNMEPVDNLDLQEEIDYLANHGIGSIAAVPEPNSFVLICLGGAWLAVVVCRTYARNRSNRKQSGFHCGAL
jgi:hypothetical protein